MQDYNDDELRLYTWETEDGKTVRTQEQLWHAEAEALADLLRARPGGSLFDGAKIKVAAHGTYYTLEVDYRLFRLTCPHIRIAGDDPSYQLSWGGAIAI